MYQPSHATTEIGRMRAEEMRTRAERYRTIQKAKQHKKTESEPEPEASLGRSRTFVYRKALGIVGLSVLMVLVFAATALAMPLDAPSGVDGKHQALITKTSAPEGAPSVDGKHQALITETPVREGPASFWEGTDVARGEIRHLVSDPVGGQDRAETQHLVPGPIGGQERAAIQHVGEADQPSTFNPAPGLSPSSGGIELELVLLLSGTAALASLGALVWFRRHTMHAA
jgi:hypothetical protein